MKKTESGAAVAREAFIREWGVLGGQWGINRTMAQIHALLLTGPDPLTTDEVMAALDISRGNAHMNLKELINWGLVRGILVKGDRKEHFAAEKDLWTMFTCILRERHRRELAPAVRAVQECVERSRGDRSAEGAALHRQLKELADFVSAMSNGLERAARMERGAFLDQILKRLKD